MRSVLKKIMTTLKEISRTGLISKFEHGNDVLDENILPIVLKSYNSHSNYHWLEISSKIRVGRLKIYITCCFREQNTPF
jgi:hypothetical protein